MKLSDKNVEAYVKQWAGFYPSKFAVFYIQLNGCTNNASTDLQKITFTIVSITTIIRKRA